MKVVSTFSAGYENLDIGLLKSRGIKTGNAANVTSDCVAEIAVALTLIAAHRIQEGRDKILRGEWISPLHNPSWLLGQQLFGAKAGIVGLGSIGLQIAVRLKAFKLERIFYTGHNEKPLGDFFLF